MKFYKMQGIGNDYVYIDCFKEKVADPAALSVRVSDRHFGIGSDGLILLCPSEKADLRMRMFNADGSEGKMCGNGIRCVGRLAWHLGICRKETMRVETLSGIKTLQLFIRDGEAESVRVDMGAPILEAARIPVLAEKSPVVGIPFKTAGADYKITCVSMGNPHAVVFTRGIDSMELEKIGPLFENHPAFPEKVNTEFVENVGESEFRMRVWERGSGETMACGTGACAVAVAACLNGFAKRGKDIVVHLRGGDLTIRWDEAAVFMTGPAQLVFTGEIEDEPTITD